jgi:hypothetical protein
MTRMAPDRHAHCEECGARLDYEIGSSMWRCQSHDLCSSCRVKRMMAGALIAKRRRPRIAPDTTARCACCGKRLDYQIGSIRWQNLDRDLCSTCSAEEMVKGMIDRVFSESGLPVPDRTLKAKTPRVPEYLNLWESADC